MERLILSAPDDVLAAAWERFCGDVDLVEVARGSILDLEVDAIVSPANSFGFMDGGLDGLYLDHFGHQIQDAVRRAIDDVLLGGCTLPRSWAEASERHQLLYTDRPRRLQH